MLGRLTRSAHLTYVAIAGVVALLQFRIIILIFGPEYRLSVEAALGVIRGEPHWRVYQSRLLGPYLVQGASSIFDTFLDAHVFCSVVLLGLCGYLVLVLLARLHGDGSRAVAGYFVFAFLVVSCFQRPWLYIWDFLDVLIFILFNYFVARGKSWRYFAVLFVVAIFNRDSAYYIALWMIGDPLIRLAWDRAQGKPRGPLDVKMLVSGVVLLAGGVALVEFLRSTLLVREVGPTLVGQVQGAGPRFHVMLPSNWERMVTALTDFRYTMSFLIPLGLLAYLAFGLFVAYRDPRERLGLALVHLLMLCSTVVFGVLFETRVYLVFIPFFVFNLWGGVRRDVDLDAGGRLTAVVRS